MTYTEISCTPSSQFDFASDDTLFAMSTDAVTATSSNGVNMMSIGVKKRLKKTSTGITNRMI